MSDPHPHLSFRALPCFVNVCNQQELQLPQVSFSHSSWMFGPYHRPGEESFTTFNYLTGAKFRRSFLVSELSAKDRWSAGKVHAAETPWQSLKDAFVYLMGKNNRHRETMLGG